MIPFPRPCPRCGGTHQQAILEKPNGERIQLIACPEMPYAGIMASPERDRAKKKRNLIIGASLFAFCAVLLLGWDLYVWLDTGASTTLSVLAWAAAWVNSGIAYTVCVFIPGHLFLGVPWLDKHIPAWARHLLLWLPAAILFTLDGLKITPLIHPGVFALWGSAAGALLWSQSWMLRYFDYPGRRQ